MSGWCLYNARAALKGLVLLCTSINQVFVSPGSAATNAVLMNELERLRT
jgi:hypothetical protein